MKNLLALGFLLAPLTAFSASFTLNSGLSYQLYESLDRPALPTSGGFVKSVVQGAFRLDCYSISRYSCALSGPSLVSTGTNYQGHSVTIASGAFQQALYQSFAVSAEGNVKRIAFNDYSFSCTSGQTCVVVLHAPIAQPPSYPNPGQPYPGPGQPYPGPGSCTTHVEACTYPGYCYFYDYRTGSYGYGYSYACQGYRHVNSCSAPTWECYPY